MKTPFHTQPAKGLTLIELTVVILVLLMLISLLFMGARAWKKGTDRAANIVNIRNAQQAARGHQNVLNLDFGAPLTEAMIYGSTAPGSVGYLRKPLPPNGEILSYDGLGTVPDIGSLWLEVTYADGAENDYGTGSINIDSW